MHDVVDVDSSYPNIYTNHKINMIRLRTLNYSLEGCVFALLADLQTSAEREHDENVSVFVRGIYITRMKIVSNIFKYNLICVCSGKWKIYSTKSLKTAYLTFYKNGDHLSLLLANLIRK